MVDSVRVASGSASSVPERMSKETMCGLLDVMKTWVKQVVEPDSVVPEKSSPELMQVDQTASSIVPVLGVLTSATAPSHAAGSGEEATSGSSLQVTAETVKQEIPEEEASETVQASQGSAEGPPEGTEENLTEQDEQKLLESTEESPDEQYVFETDFDPAVGDDLGEL